MITTPADILRVLIADDHEGFRHELRDTLARESDIHVVADESNGAAAIRRVRTLRPDGLDLVLLAGGVLVVAAAATMPALRAGLLKPIAAIAKASAPRGATGRVLRKSAARAHLPRPRRRGCGPMSPISAWRRPASASPSPATPPFRLSIRI